jgi:hypothetical protein
VDFLQHSKYRGGWLSSFNRREDVLIPNECQLIVDDLRESLRPELEFLKDIIATDESSLIPVGELYFRDKSWAGEKGIIKCHRRNLVEKLKDI